MRPLYHGSGCYVPLEVAKCPECGAELTARSMQWNAATGEPHGEYIDICCTADPDLNHHYHQDRWQPVRDAIVRWCRAYTEPPRQVSE